MVVLRSNVAVLALLSACSSVVGGQDSGDASSSSGSSDAGSVGSASMTSSGTTGTGTTTSASTTSTTTAADTTTAGNDDASDGPTCVLFHHEVGSLGGCNTDASCCPGEKCVPSPDYSSCVPLDPAAVGVGEACTRMGENDDCVAGAVCRSVDPVTQEGTCVEICDFGHTCDDAELECFLQPEPLCERTCDPLGGPACEAGTTCLPNALAQTFACVPDERIGQPGQPGDPCVPNDDTFAGCDALGLCVPDGTTAIESCANDLDDACCTWLCAIGDPGGCVGVGDEICEPLSTLLGDTWAEDTFNVGYCR